MIIGIGISSLKGGESIINPMFQQVDGLGKISALEEVVTSKIWQIQLPLIVELGQEYVEEKDLDKKLTLWAEIVAKLEKLGLGLVDAQILDINSWEYRWNDVVTFTQRVNTKQTNIMDNMYLR